MTDSSNDPTAEQLLVEISEGNHESFRTLHIRFEKALVATAFLVMRDESAARDAVQDALIAVWNNAGQFDPQAGKASTWLFAIVRNKAIDHHRRRKRRLEVQQSAISEGTWLPDIPVPDKALLSSERAAEVSQCLRRMPIKQREVLMFSFYGGMSQSEIAEKTGEPLGTVKSRIRRGIGLAKSMLSNVPPIAEP